MTRKTRSMEWGSGRWLGDEWVDAIALGTERASPEAARELADEVLRFRKLRRLFAREVRTYGEMLEENHGAKARGLLLAVASRLCTSEELYGDQPDKIDDVAKKSVASVTQRSDSPSCRR